MTTHYSKLTWEKRKVLKTHRITRTHPQTLATSNIDIETDHKLHIHITERGASTHGAQSPAVPETEQGRGRSECGDCGSGRSIIVEHNYGSVPRPL